MANNGLFKNYLLHGSGKPVTLSRLEKELGGLRSAMFSMLLGSTLTQDVERRVCLGRKRLNDKQKNKKLKGWSKR